jgi:coenzyme F420-dependent glucose-6-phosphate dehydrogenase
MENIKIGYHASHEQFKPSLLLDLVQQAQQAGFTESLSSDHYFPWSETQGESGFAWSWLGAAMQATKLGFGIVNAPGQRYHPAIIAQAVATLCEMNPGRFWIAVGSGQFLNEHIDGNKWPLKAVRNERLKESVDIMRALWRGETVSHQGHIKVSEAKLYTRPDYIPTVIGAALTESTARWVGGWADGMITTSREPSGKAVAWASPFTLRYSFLMTLLTPKPWPGPMSNGKIMFFRLRCFQTSVLRKVLTPPGPW